MTQPKKPMVPSAPTSPAINPSRPMRRHIGEPLGSSESDERRPAKSTNRATIGAKTSVRQRTTGFEQRAVNDEGRAT